MKLGIISDIHSNVEALKEVLAALERENCDKIICAGDVVGYGASPRICIDILRECRILCVRGNHDDLVLNPHKRASQKPAVRQVIQWTHNVLPDTCRRWLASLPDRIMYGQIEIVHASHVFHPDWQYIVNHPTLVISLLFQSSAVSFNGHTHLPLMASHERGKRPSLNWLSSTSLVAEKKYLINVGSVGQPRDLNPKAAFVTYETTNRTLRLHRVTYDWSLAQSRIREAGLPSLFADRLDKGQ